MVRSGSSGQPIVFIGNNTKLIFSSEFGWDWTGYKDYLEIHNMEIEGGGVRIQGSYNKLTHCYFSGTGGAHPLNVWGGSYNYIAYNEANGGGQGWNCWYIESDSQ